MEGLVKIRAVWKRAESSDGVIGDVEFDVAKMFCGVERSFEED